MAPCFHRREGANILNRTDVGTKWNHIFNTNVRRKLPLTHILKGPAVLSCFSWTKGAFITHKQLNYLVERDPVAQQCVNQLIQEHSE